MKTDLQKYQQGLCEIKQRIIIISSYLQKEATTGHLITEIEFLCLQFRKIIEEIAFLSLIANKEEYSKQYVNFEKHWNAKYIFKDLERINPRFYPEPSEKIEKLNKEGIKYFELEKFETGFMTKEDAIKIHEKCGGMMHAHNPFRGKKDLKQLQSNFTEWLNRIIKLLNHHSILLHGKGHIVIGIMQSKDNGLPAAYDCGEISKEEQTQLKKKM